MKKQIGYTLKKSHYNQETAILNMIIQDGNGWSNEIKKGFHTFSTATERAKELGVLDLWFDVVYEQEYAFKEGDWLYCTKNYTSIVSRGDVFQAQLNCNGGLMVNEMTINGGDDYTSHFRLATPGEIKKVTQPKFNVGDWVIANGTNHTRNNSSFPTTIAWKIESFVDDGIDKKDFHAYVDKSSTTIAGVCTNINSIRHATSDEIQHTTKLVEEENGVNVGGYKADLYSGRVKFGCKELTKQQVEAVNIVSKLVVEQLGQLSFNAMGDIASNGDNHFSTTNKVVTKLLSKMR